MAANRDTFQTLFAYSVALVVAGLGAFALARQPAVTAALGVSTPGGRDALSAAAGLVAVNAVLALYVRAAFAEGPDAPPAPPRMPPAAPKRD